VLTREQEARVFDDLCRHSGFRDWLSDQLDRQVEVLMVNPDHAAIMKAQGAAGFVKALQDRLAAAESAAKR